ncbi:hypothetical protein V6Z12_A07G032300 [Gossypium hirsutum]
MSLCRIRSSKLLDLTITQSLKTLLPIQNIHPSFFFPFTVFAFSSFIISLKAATSASLPLITTLSDSTNSLWQTKQADDFTSFKALALTTCPQFCNAKNLYFPLNSSPIIRH